MDKIRIGLIVYAQSNPLEGGGHSYYDALLKGINEYAFDDHVEIINIVFYSNHIPDVHFSKPCVYIKNGESAALKSSIKRTASKYPLLNLTGNPIIQFLSLRMIKRRNKKIEETLRQNKIDLIYYMKPAYQVLNYPFIVTHWDVAHKSIDAFPEVTLNGEYEARERYYLYTLNKAFIIICESETGAEELRSFYSILPGKIKVVPAFGGNIIHLKIPEDKQQQLLEKYRLEKNRFFIYPAQFWAHKNHYNLVTAFYKLVKETNNKQLKLVLCGSDKGNEEYIKQVVTSLSLNEQVIFRGFVSDEELHIYYRNALALIMPTFLGPTNMPLIEAAHLGCPIACSDMKGHQEIMGDHALYFEPANSDSVKETMHILLNENKRSALATSAKLHISQSVFVLDHSLKVLQRILADTIPIRKTWGINSMIRILLLVIAGCNDLLEIRL